MPVDASIYNRRLGFDAVGALDRGMDMRHKQDERQKMQKLDEAHNKLSGMAGSAFEGTGAAGFKAKAGAEDQKHKVAARNIQFGAQILGSARGPEDWQAGLQRLSSLGMDTSRLPQQFSPEAQQQVVQAAQSASQQIAQGNIEQSMDLNERKFSESVRHNRAAEELSRAAAAAKKEAVRAKKAEKAAKKARGKELTANMVKKINEGNQIPMMLRDVADTIQGNKDVFGPISGRARQMNPYDEKAQAINAQTRASSQAFGRFMEGGVLRKEDEEKYRKMFPNLSDTPETAANKLAIVERLLQQKQASDVEAFKTQGYDLSGLDGATAVRAVPEAIASGGGDDLDQMSDEELDKILVEAGAL